MDGQYINEFDIVPVCGHYNIYIDGNFYCSADTYNEAVDELRDAGYLK